jgi:hypothetical protein
MLPSPLYVDPVAESLLAFWAEAGVDAMLLDEPFDRIEAGKIRAPAAPVPRAPVAATPSAAPRWPDVAGAVAQARELAAQAQDLEALAAAIATFEGCPLRFEGAASKSVFYRGAIDAPLMVVGEAPAPRKMPRASRLSARGQAAGSDARGRRLY